MLRNLFLLMISLTVMFFVSCSDDDDNGTNNNDFLNGTFNAKINGDDFSPTTVLASKDPDGTVSINASTLDGALVNLVMRDAAVGDFNNGIANITVQDPDNSESAITYYAESMTYKITKLTDTEVAGTFSFTAAEITGSGETIEVSNGNFDLKFNM